ncbi:unnamed protein product [Blepharisma stoltei]|uniref:RING-type domain-containing protein n=1 Tax=Blepharisma stoltei TaxID=1481888 RepID=A0AAU9J4C8_9CILI|nr:unnamed protein product [Blepharisma stoltei]
MVEPKFILLPKEPIILHGELANFKWKSRIDPPIKSSYLAICIAYLESLLRVKDVEVYRSSWIALGNYKKETDELVKKRPNYSNYWTQFDKIIESFNNPKFKPLQLLRLYAERNHLGACDALDASMRLLICVVTDKDYKFDEILTQPFNFMENRNYLEHFCNKLEVNFLIVNETEHTYVSRSDKNKSPLVTLYMERDYSWSVLYHQEYELLAAGNAGIGDLDRFPFVYDPRSEPVRVGRPLVSGTPIIPTTSLEPSPIIAQPQFVERSYQEQDIRQQNATIPEEIKERPPTKTLQKAKTSGGSKKIAAIKPKNTQIHKESKQEALPVPKESSPINVPEPKKVSQEPSSPENAPELEEAKQGSIYYSVIEENPKPDLSPAIEISNQLISEMASTILLNCPNKCSDLLVKLLSDYTAINPSADKGDIARLKETASKWKPAAQPPPILPAKKESSCGHLKVNFTPLCQLEHCAYCLKEIYERDRHKSVCSHGKKISPKNMTDINKLLSEQGQINKDGIEAEMVVQAEEKSERAQELIKTSSKAPLMPEQPRKVDIFAINQENIFRPGPVLQSFPVGNNQSVKIINLANDQQLSGDHEVQSKYDDSQPSQKNFLELSNSPPYLQQKIIPKPSQLQPNPLQDVLPPKMDLEFSQKQPHMDPDPSQNPLQLNSPPHPPQKIIPQPSQLQPNPLQDALPQRVDIDFSQKQLHMDPDLVQIPSVINPTPNPPQRRNDIKCAVCFAYKDVDEFSITCPNHQVCNICRIKSMEQCKICQRFYSKNDQETLEIIRISFNN